MMFVGRVPLQQLGKLLGFFAIVGVFGLSMIMLIGEDKNEEKADKQILTEQVKDSNAATGKRTGLFHRFDTWKARIDKFLNSEEVSPEDYDLDKDAQVAHANIAIASSNIMGIASLTSLPVRKSELIIFPSLASYDSTSMLPPSTTGTISRPK